MKIKTPSDNLILLPMEVLPRVKNASATELKVLLFLFAKKEALPAEMAQQLGISPADAEAAVAFWRGAGIFEEDNSSPKKEVAPSTSLYKSYDSHTIASYLEEDTAFRSCTDLVAETFGAKILNKNELSSLLYLYNYVGLPAEVISGIAIYCKTKGKTSMQYMMKTALSMYEKDGIDTYEKFEQYMTVLEKRNADSTRLRTMLGFGERALSAKEKEFFTRWMEEWALPFELISLAYEKTVDNLHKVNLSYMNAMLKRWYECGYTTPEDVEIGDSKAKTEKSSDASYGDSDAFFEAALKAGFNG